VFILKLAIVTCAFYMGITLLLFAGLMVLVHSKGIVGYCTELAFLGNVLWPCLAGFF